MRKIVLFVLLLSLLVGSAHVALTQTRARRTGQNVPHSSSPPTSPQIPSARNEGQPLPSSKEAPQEVAEDEVVRVDTTLVTIPVSIMDRSGRYIADLRKEDFRIFEDGIEQEVAYFAAVEKPFTVVLMLDTSSSTWSKLGQIKDAASAFVDQLRREDQVMVVSFAGGVKVLAEPTSDRKILHAAIQRTGRGLSTHLYDAVEWVTKKRLSKASGRKAVVLFTDGVDATSSHATYESNMRDAEELDAIIYPVQYDTYKGQGNTSGDQSPAPSSRWPSGLPSIIRRLPIPLPIPTISGGGAGSSRADYARGAEYLRDLAEVTGGRVYPATDISYLKQAFSDIAEALRRQYSLGYYPRIKSKESRRRQIRVRVTRPNLVVRARDSYIYKPSTDVSNTTANTGAQDNDRQPTTPVLQKKPFIVRR